MDSAPRANWPPHWIAFYEGKALRKDLGIFKFARVEGVDVQSREQLFPGEPAGRRTGRLYYVLRLGPIQERAAPIGFPHHRRFAFISTTMKRFEAAETVNDLFADSPLEDRLWEAFKENAIPAEREWEQRVRGTRYYLDFALFCGSGKIDVEADGDTYHLSREHGPRDNARNNELEAFGWHVLRFESARILDRIRSCVDPVLELVQRLDGFRTTALVPTHYVINKDGHATPQLSLFESRSDYDSGD